MKSVWIFLFFLASLEAKVEVGLERVFYPPYDQQLTSKRVGLLCNHTAIDSSHRHAIELFKEHADKKKYRLAALFAPEHGIRGEIHASDQVEDERDRDGVPIFSLHGKTKRPTPEMLTRVDLLVCDIQDIGSRSYTYLSTLLMAMEEAAKAKVPVIVLDRPNPLGGLLVDGPMLQEKWRSIVGYLNVPYIHGMTIGELARYFNEEYNIGCDLRVVPMRGWRRKMPFADTGLTWVPTSPNIPEADTPWYYPTTGILGELQMVSIGIGYTLPFKIVGAPWINAEEFAEKLNSQQFGGVAFLPTHFRPFSGKFNGESCHGVRIVITDRGKYKPVETLFLIIGMLKSLYPTEFKKALEDSKKRIEMFYKVTGSDEVYNQLVENDYVIWKLKGLHAKERQQFMKKRDKYLIKEYQ